MTSSNCYWIPLEIKINMKWLVKALAHLSNHTKHLSNGEVVNHIITFLIGGYETTANTLTFTT